MVLHVFIHLQLFMALILICFTLISHISLTNDLLQLVRMELSGYSSWTMLRVKVSSMNVEYLDGLPLMLMLFAAFR